MSDSLWYKDAVIYQLHVKSYRDSNADGFGDFKGLIERLDYIQQLGVNCVWLLPFYPSPLRDDGYDISSYESINPTYGTTEDFKSLLNAAHQRGIRAGGHNEVVFHLLPVATEHEVDTGIDILVFNLRIARDVPYPSGGI